jgi:hypothetical protein
MLEPIYNGGLFLQADESFYFPELEKLGFLGFLWLTSQLCPSCPCKPLN